jgi:hypothetical protein
MIITTEQRLTLLTTLLITAGVLLWDWFLMRDGVPGNTISAALKSISSCIPIPLIFGIWTAHMFWHQPGAADVEHRIHRMVAFAIIIVASYLWWELSSDRVRLWASAHPEVVFPIGYVSGHWVWPQFTGSIGS